MWGGRLRELPTPLPRPRRWRCSAPPSRSCPPTTTPSCLACTATQTSPSAGCRQGAGRCPASAGKSACPALTPCVSRRPLPAGCTNLRPVRPPAALWAALLPLPSQPSLLMPSRQPSHPLTVRLQVQDAMQLVIDTAPRSGGGGTGQTREEVVDSMCEDLLAKVGAAKSAARRGAGPVSLLRPPSSDAIGRLVPHWGLAEMSLPVARICTSGAQQWCCAMALPPSAHSPPEGGSLPRVHTHCSQTSP